MMPDTGPLLAGAIDLTVVLLVAALIVAAVRLARGPSLPDRVVALDLMTVLAVALSATYALDSGEAAFLDVAIALALVAFLATVALARFAERRSLRARDDAPESGAEPR